MEQRDIIKNQIEQMGKVMGKLISKFLDLKTMGDVNDAIQVTNRGLKEEVGIDVDALLSCNKKDLKKWVINRCLGEKTIENLSGYFRMVGESKMDYQKEEAIQYFQKAIELLELSDEFSEVYSMNRMGMRKKLNSLINDCSLN